MQVPQQPKKLTEMHILSRAKVPLHLKVSLASFVLTVTFISILGYIFNLELISLNIVHDKHLVQSLEQIKFKLIIAIIVTLIVAATLSFIIIKRLCKPLVSMTNLMASEHSLKIIKELPTGSNDEIGILAKAYYNLHEMNSFKEQQVANQQYSIDQHAIVSVTDAKGYYTFVNSKLEEVSGYSKEELIGQQHTILVSESNNVSLLKDAYKKITQGQVWKGEICHISKSGNEYWLDATLVPILDDAGLPYQYISVLTNITKAKNNLIALQESEERLALSSSIANDGLWDWDITSNSVYYDERYYSMAGYQSSDFKADFLEWEKRVHADDINQVKKHLEGYLAGTIEYFDTEFRFLKKDNNYMWIRGKGRVVEYADNNAPIRMIGTHQDITDIKTFENKLINAKNKAEKAVKSKSEFFASMSHEIRTPMNGVLGMLGLMMRTDLNKQQKHYATLARSSADSLLAIIDDILDLSKIDAGKIELEAIDFDLREQLGIFAESMAYRAQDKGLELVLDISEIEQTMVNGDPSRLRQILSNLVGNAIKFTESGHVKIVGSLKVFDKNEWYFCCEVSDTGMGIPSDKVELLFDSYSQVDSSTTRKFGGTGLGLAIVKQLTDLMEGSVRAESDYGKGSTFIFKIRIGVSHQSQAVYPDFNISNKKILIVDNSNENLMTVAKQLKQWGALVVTAVGGLQAIEILREKYSVNNHHFDLAIIDMDMPIMNGAKLGKIIRGNIDYNQLKLVMMTSMEGSSDVSEFKHLGFSAYFPKPAITSDLFHALNVLNETNDDEWTETQNGSENHQLSGSNIFSNAHILLVEDNPINQAVANGILGDMGIAVDIAENGKQAIEKLKDYQKNYGLVLMDCQMPEMDGYEATLAIRSKESEVKNSKIPIIAMTANALKGDRERCLKIGMDDYLTKPIDPNALEKMLRHWLPKSQQDHHLQALNEKEYQPGSENKDKLEGENLSGSTDLVWDKEALMGRVRNNEKLAGKLVQLFLNDLPGLLESLKEAVKNESFDDITAHSHRIKGSASNLSAIAVSKTAAKIEKASRTENMESVEEEMGLFENQVAELLASLEGSQD